VKLTRSDSASSDSQEGSSLSYRRFIGQNNLPPSSLLGDPNAEPEEEGEETEGGGREQSGEGDSQKTNLNRRFSDHR
jgi:hypothetical protein